MTIQTICESRDLSYSALMCAVEEFVDSVVENASTELYQATAKRLLGESLSHDDIMVGIPYCTPDDLIILERATNPDDIVFNVSTNAQIRTMLTRLKLGRKGLSQVWDQYQSLLARDGNSPEATMARTAGIFGLDTKSVQIILTKMSIKNSKLKEHYLRMADEVLVEEVPTNTAGSTMPDHDASDGKSCSIVVKRKKKIKDLVSK